MPQTPTAQFDVQGARKAGYSDDEILQHLTQSRGFDIQGAIKNGYSKQEIIDHLSANPAQSSTPFPGGPVPGAPGGTPPGIPAPPYPGALSPNAPTTNQNMTLAMSGQQAQMTPENQKQFESGKAAGTITGANIASAGPIIEGGIAAAPAVGRSILGGVAGGAAGTYAGKNIGGYFGHPQEGAAIGGTLGGLAGGYRAARGGKIPGKIGEWFQGAEEGTATPKPNPFEGATSSATPQSVSELPPPSQGSTTSTTTSGAKVSGKGLTPPPPPQATYVQKFGAPEKGIIIDPNAPNPPPINKTLVSYDRDQLLQMAKQGDLDAIHELVRNPRGINLREALPNVKFLMEPGRSTRIYGGPGSAKALLPAVGIVGTEFNKLGLADPVNPRQQTTLETMMNGPRWKDFDRSEKIEAVRDVLGRK